VKRTSFDTTDRRHNVERKTDTTRGKKPADRAGWAAADEALVRDVRAGLTPAQMVERKLVSLLDNTPLPMSRLQTTRVQRPRP
jgi:hypothetical protein